MNVTVTVLVTKDGRTNEFLNARVFAGPTARDRWLADSGFGYASAAGRSVAKWTAGLFAFETFTEEVRS